MCIDKRKVIIVLLYLINVTIPEDISSGRGLNLSMALMVSKVG